MPYTSKVILHSCIYDCLDKLISWHDRAVRANSTPQKRPRCLHGSDLEGNATNISYAQKINSYVLQ